MISIIILFAVFVLIALRQVIGRRTQLKLEIWHIMLFGALAVLLTFQIQPLDALVAVNLEVIFFLFGMFVIGEALEASGYLSHLSHRLFGGAKSTDHLLLLILFGMGAASALLMNDTLAIIGTPVVLLIAKRNRLSPKLLLLALAFAITIGSVMSPIGNPQNLLIATGGNIPNPFVTFFGYLFLPTMINLLIAYLLLRLFFKKEFKEIEIERKESPIKDKRLALLSKASLVLIAVLIAAKVAIVVLAPSFDFKLTYIALVSAVPILVFSPRRVDVLKKVDWRTLVFFVAMFVLMASVWKSGFFQPYIANMGFASVVVILAVSILLSQVLSNVPLVALYLPMILAAGASTKEMLSLAAGSTVAGNLFILGAASNVIIIQSAEKKYGETLTFAEFARVGIPLTLFNAFVYWAFLSFV